MQGSVQLVELKKALRRLREAASMPKNDIVRDSVIQRFEFTVELSWKALARRLRSEGLAESLTPKAAIREGARLGFVADSEAWLNFLDDRNLSSHTYKEDLAERVYAAACRFPSYVDALIQNLEK
jgi:nucleotidyltransferase substrate binding protein (TIGR01987 family)